MIVAEVLEQISNVAKVSQKKESVGRLDYSITKKNLRYGNSTSKREQL